LCPIKGVAHSGYVSLHDGVFFAVGIGQSHDGWGRRRVALR
jgi:hypothetical protein